MPKLIKQLYQDALLKKKQELGYEYMEKLEQLITNSELGRIEEKFVKLYFDELIREYRQKRRML